VIQSAKYQKIVAINLACTLWRLNVRGAFSPFLPIASKSIPFLIPGHIRKSMFRRRLIRDENFYQNNYSLAINSRNCRQNWTRHCLSNGVSILCAYSYFTRMQIIVCSVLIFNSSAICRTWIRRSCKIRFSTFLTFSSVTTVCGLPGWGSSAIDSLPCWKRRPAFV
jgi:hypothetical protein